MRDASIRQSVQLFGHRYTFLKLRNGGGIDSLGARSSIGGCHTYTRVPALFSALCRKERLAISASAQRGRMVRWGDMLASIMRAALGRQEMDVLAPLKLVI